MAEEDEEKTAFHVGQDVYCHKRMPFSLKNVEATYHRLIGRAFEKQIGRNLGVCDGYLIIQSKTKGDLLYDVEETFAQLRKINLKLNPRMCSLGIEREDPNEHPPTNRRIQAISSEERSISKT
jgi:hypothetical protein